LAVVPGKFDSSARFFTGRSVVIGVRTQSPHGRQSFRYWMPDHSVNLATDVNLTPNEVEYLFGSSD
jgi:hypothetical protein